jgi:hypothetical protein
MGTDSDPVTLCPNSVIYTEKWEQSKSGVITQSLLSFCFMFCRQKNKSGEMSGSKDDTPDPKTGLTPREHQIVVETWDILRPNAKEVGVELFNRLVDSYT